MLALITLICTLLAPCYLQAQTRTWKNASGTGPNLSEIVKGPDGVLFGMLGRRYNYNQRVGHLLIVSADNGRTWQPRGSKFFTSLRSLYCPSAGLLLVGTEDSGFVSTDQGATWSYDADQRLMVDVVRSKQNALFTSLYATLSKSTNSGLDWTVINQDIDGDYGLCIDSSGKLWSSNRTARQLQYSVDEGQNWTPVPSMQSNNRVRCGVDGTVYIVGNGHYSQTGYKKDELNIVRPGSSETEFVCHLIGRVWSFNLLDSALLYVSDSGCFRSSNAGATWNQVSIAGENSDPYLWIVGEGFDSVIFCLSYHDYQHPKSQVHRSTNFGKSWRQCGIEMKDRFGSRIATLASGQFFIGGRSVISTTDQGLNWVVSREFSRMNSLTSSDNNLFVGIYGAAWKSSDHGESWDSLRIESNGHTYDASILCVDSNKHIFAQLGSLYRSDDQGQSWTEINSDQLLLWQMECLSGGSLLAMNSDYELLTSADLANSWRPVTLDLDSSDRVKLIFGGHSNSFFVGTEKGRIFRSQNAGSSWDLVFNVDSPIMCMSETISSELTIGTWGCGLWSSYDNGNNWIRSDSELPKRTRFIEVANVPGSNTLGLLTQDSFYISIEPKSTVAARADIPEVPIGFIPASRSLRSFSDFLGAHVAIRDAVGRIVLEADVAANERLYLGALSQGVFWINARFTDGHQFTQRILLP